MGLETSGGKAFLIRQLFPSIATARRGVVPISQFAGQMRLYLLTRNLVRQSLFTRRDRILIDYPYLLRALRQAAGEDGNMKPQPCIRSFTAHGGGVYLLI